MGELRSAAVVGAELLLVMSSPASTMLACTPLAIFMEPCPVPENVSGVLVFTVSSSGEVDTSKSTPCSPPLTVMPPNTVTVDAALARAATQGCGTEINSASNTTIAERARFDRDR